MESLENILEQLERLATRETIFLVVVFGAVTGLSFALLRGWFNRRTDGPWDRAKTIADERSKQTSRANQQTAGLSALPPPPPTAIACSTRAAPAALTHPHCHWAKDFRQPKAGMTRWLCKSCREFGYTTGRMPPVECKWYLRGGKL
jgi:hypothetical protein